MLRSIGRGPGYEGSARIISFAQGTVMGGDPLHDVHRPVPVYGGFCLCPALSPLLHPGTGGLGAHGPRLGGRPDGLRGPGYGPFFPPLGLARGPARPEDHGREGHVRRGRHPLRHGAGRQCLAASPPSASLRGHDRDHLGIDRPGLHGCPQEPSGLQPGAHAGGGVPRPDHGALDRGTLADDMGYRCTPSWSAGSCS